MTAGKTDESSRDIFIHNDHNGIVQSGADQSGIHFAKLSPLEKGFFAGVEGGRINRQVIQELYALIAEGNEMKAIQKLFAKSNKALPSRKSRQELIQSLPCQLPESRIRYFQERHYNYFEELKKQYTFYRAGETMGRYALAGGDNWKEEKLEKTSAVPMVALIIDGIHSLGVGNPEDEFLHSGQMPVDISIGRLKNRIRQLKGEEVLDDPEMKRWSHVPFLFRLANHFGNGMFGHARSFSDATQVMLDQRRYLDKGIIKGSGYEIALELLGLDENAHPTGSKRILIDMLHLSAAARNDLYEKIYRTYNKNIAPQHPIPIVFSNAAYSGVDYLAEMMKNARDGVEIDGFCVDGFNAGGINLSDEDVLAVFWSGGLIGISLEEHRMGKQPSTIERLFARSSRAQALRLLARQVAGMVSVPFAYNVPEPLKIWNSLTVGHGLSGDDRLLAHYQETTNSQRLLEDLEEVLTKLKKQEPFWFGAWQPAALSRKLCYENVKEFVSRNF